MLLLENARGKHSGSAELMRQRMSARRPLGSGPAGNPTRRLAFQDRDSVLITLPNRTGHDTPPALLRYQVDDLPATLQHIPGEYIGGKAHFGGHQIPGGV